jgi:isopentenyl diphosphate isomerase/L-lactate dehydrogenase-like FMN-dependent dehydrogenase
MTCAAANRRQFFRFLAGSPLAARAWAQQPAGSQPALKDLLNLMEFEEPAHKALPPAHWGYLTTGVDDDLTLKANREGFRRFQLRPRRLVDVSKVDTSIELFGTKWESPIFICPVGSQKAFHPEGEVAVAKAARSRHTLQILSTVSSISVEDVAGALGTPPWFQLYMPVTWEMTEKLVKRVEAAGCPAIAWTIDLLAGRNTETLERFRRVDTRQCIACHQTAQGGVAGPNTTMAQRKRPMFAGLDGGINPSQATWEYVDRLKKLTKMKLLLKGIDNGDDARLCREHGVDGIVLSNHGGRAAETGRGTIECLSEVVEGAGNIPVLVDGGFRRGTDVYKALALGARAVGIGRPYIWGLSAFGQEGVERVIDILRGELQLTMRQCGTPAIRQITRAAIVKS